MLSDKPNYLSGLAFFKFNKMNQNEELPEWMQELIQDLDNRLELKQMIKEVEQESQEKRDEARKAFSFYMLPVEIAASKELTQAEKLVGAYLFTICTHRKKFKALDTLIARKANLRREYIPIVLKRLKKVGLIQFEESISGKRLIVLKKNEFSGRFLKLHALVAESRLIIPEEKILISYILSFHDNGKPFYAKNGVVNDLLNITKEGFTQCRKHFEELGWVKVKFPKTPKRELVVLEHPLDYLNDNK